MFHREVRRGRKPPVGRWQVPFLSLWCFLLVGLLPSVGETFKIGSKIDVHPGQVWLYVYAGTHSV